MTKRWISLLVENDVGVLAKVSGLFSGKFYNLESLTVGKTEDSTVSRITISLLSDDDTFEQIKKQLNRCVEVIKVIDLTNIKIHTKEIMYIKIKDCKKEDKSEILIFSNIFNANIIDYDDNSVLIECLQTEEKNDDLIKIIKKNFKSFEITCGGSVSVEALISK